jgi:hypothetical protein
MDSGSDLGEHAEASTGLLPEKGVARVGKIRGVARLQIFLVALC